MLKVILAGHTGLEKSLAASNLKRALEEIQPDWGGNRVHVFDLEDCIDETAGGNAALYAGATPTSTQRVKWMKGWKRLLQKIDEERPYCAIVTMHLVLASKGFRSYPLDLGEMADWGPEFVITLIDDVYSVKRRIQLKDFHFSFAQLYEWRTSEIMLADQIGRLAARYYEDGRQAGVESLVVPVKTPAMTLARLLTQRQHPRVYASYPISSTRESPEDRKEIDDFRRKLHKIIPTFDPLTIEEIPLLKCKQQCGDTISFHPTEEPDGTPKTMKETRWDCRIGTGSWAPLVWEPEIAQDSVGGEVGFFPVEFARTELEELFYASPDGGDLVNDHVTARDLRFVDQADVVVCYRPFWHGPVSKGVARELTHANSTSKPIIAYIANDAIPDGPLQPKFTHQPKDFDHFWALIKEEALREQTLPRPEYY
jgi:hypothetical protein